MYIVIFVILSFVTSAVNSYVCPSPRIPYCSCKDDTCHQPNLQFSCGINNLSQLDLLSNSIYNSDVSTLSVYYKDIRRIPSSHFYQSNLVYLHIGGKVTSIDRYAFFEIKDSLKELNVRSTDITELPLHAINEVSLRSLSFEGHQFHTIRNGITVNLNHLSLRDNNISILGRRPDMQLFPLSLRTLDLSINSLRRLRGTVRENALLKSFNITKNRIDRLSGELGNTTSLEKLFADFNQIVTIEDTFSNTTQLTYLGLRHNNLTQITEGLLGLTNLKVLSLGHNHLITLHRMAIRDLVYLEQLYLDHNDIAIFEETAFDCLNSLKHLDVSFNKLTRLDFLSQPAPCALSPEGCSFREYITLETVVIGSNRLFCNNVTTAVIEPLISKGVRVDGYPCSS